MANFINGYSELGRHKEYFDANMEASRRNASPETKKEKFFFVVKGDCVEGFSVEKQRRKE